MGRCQPDELAFARKQKGRVIQHRPAAKAGSLGVWDENAAAWAGRRPARLELPRSPPDLSLMQLFTLGFTRKTAERFFGLLRESGAKRLVDVRLNRISQLAGFAKRDDLRYFARELCDLEYVEMPELAPTGDLLGRYRRSGSWDEYAREFVGLMAARKVEETVPRALLEHGCLLCSEHGPEHCHRRLVAEYLREKWGTEVEIRHLM